MACGENEVDVWFDTHSRNDVFSQGQQLYSASMRLNAFVDEQWMKSTFVLHDQFLWVYKVYNSE